MTSLIKTVKVSNALLKNNPIFITAVRNHWNKDYKPGPYPTTEAEKAAAAEKYGIPLAEYQAYPNDGTGSGDYPALPAISDDAKDPYYPWDYPELKRNFNEVLHRDHDFMREDRIDVTTRRQKSMTQVILEFLGVMVGTFGLYALFERVKLFHPLVPKEYPEKGKVHYTFEKE